MLRIGKYCLIEFMIYQRICKSQIDISTKIDHVNILYKVIKLDF